ncbi:MAG: hypothetical protein HZY79_00685 [Rhodoblastus sp.]|nr:MAG: hypothetical protein HZY79_00685 [Rhodoblastus sp.]
MREPLPEPAGQAADRRIARRALILVALLCAPVVGLILLQIGVFAACRDETIARGVAPGHLQWRVTKMQCGDDGEPFYDVAVGAENETLSTALTSRGTPVPLDVVRLGKNLAGVRLDRPRDGTKEDVVRVTLRRSGSPSERIDLQADAGR